MNYAVKIARRELKDFSTDWRVVVPVLMVGLAFPALLAAVINMVLPYMMALDSRIIVEKIVPFGAVIVGFLPTCFSLILALESFVGEKERNTLETLLSLPVSDKELFFGKFLAVLVPTGGVGIVGLVIYALSLQLVVGFTVALDFLLLVIMLAEVGAVVMIAAAVVISGHTSSVRAASLLSMFIIVPMAALTEMQAIMILMGKWEILWLTLCALLVVGSILVRLGVKVFNREEILTRENGPLDLKVIFARFVGFLKQTPRGSLAQSTVGARPLTLWRLLAVDIPQLLHLNLRPMGLVSALLVAGGVAGFSLAQWYRVQIPVDNISGAGVAMLFDPTVGVVDWSESIFIHNARAVLMASGLAIFTFGVGAIVTLMAPMGITGFLAGGISGGGASPLVFLAAFIVPHGIAEFPALVIAGTFGLRVGMSIMSPPSGFTIGDSLLLAVVNWVKIIPLVITLLMVAAVLETNLTPQVIKLLYGG